MKLAQSFLFLAAGFCLAQVVIISFAVDDLKKSSQEFRREVESMNAHIEVLQKRTIDLSDRVDAIYNEMDRKNNMVSP